MRYTIFMACALLAGCSSPNYTPAGPASVVPPMQNSVSGHYLGSISYSSGFIPIVARLHQSGLAFTGDWWTVDRSVTGTVDGTIGSLTALTPSLQARWTLNAPNLSGGRCVGETQTSGSAFPIDLRAATLPLAGCTPLQNLRVWLDMTSGTID